MGLYAQCGGHGGIRSRRVVTKFRVVDQAGGRTGIVRMHKRVAVVGGFVANVLGIGGNNIEFVSGNVVAHHIPSVVAYP